VDSLRLDCASGDEGDHLIVGWTPPVAGHASRFGAVAELEAYRAQDDELVTVLLTPTQARELAAWLTTWADSTEVTRG